MSAYLKADDWICAHTALAISTLQMVLWGYLVIGATLMLLTQGFAA